MMKSEAVKRQLFGYFQSIGFYEYKNGWMKGDCVSCGAEDKYGVHLENNRTHCFRCEFKDSPLDVVKHTNGIPSFGKLLEFLKGYDSADYKPVKAEIYPEKPIILPEGFRLLKYGDQRVAKLARNYVRSRGFNTKDLSRKGVGYVARPNAEYFGYLVFPFYKDRKVIFFQTRLFYGSGPKFKNPLREDFGIGKSQLIYNEQALYGYKEVGLMESVFNVLTMGNNGTGIQGKVMSMIQTSKIIKSPVEIVNIMMDKDAWKYALDIANLLIGHKKVRLIEFEDDRDVNDLGKEVVDEMIQDTPLISTASELIKYINR